MNQHQPSSKQQVTLGGKDCSNKFADKTKSLWLSLLLSGDCDRLGHRSEFRHDYNGLRTSSQSTKTVRGQALSLL